MPAILSADGMLFDLNKIDSLDLTTNWWDQKSIREFLIYETQYAVTGDLNFFNKGAPITNFFNKNLMEKVFSDSLYELVRSGKWTLDKMIAMAMAIAHDVNGDGVMNVEDDCYGFMGEHSTINQILRGSGQRFSMRDSDDEIKILINTEKTATVVEKFIPFIRDKSVSIYAQDWGQKYTNPYTELMLPKFIDNMALFYSNQLLVALNLRNMEADFGILPLPKYDEEQEDYINVTNNSWCTYVIVPVTNGDLDMTGHVLNALGYYSRELITGAFINTTVLNKAIRDEDSAEMLELIFNTQDFDIATYYNWGNVHSMFSSLTNNINTSYASEYAKIETAILNAMQKTVTELKGK